MDIMTKNEIIKIIQRISGKKINVSLNENLLSNQILDSLSIMLLISEIEKKLKKKINMKKFKIDNLKSINKVDKFFKSEKNS